MIILKILFGIVWFILHFFIWIIAFLMTFIRFPSIGEFSTEKFGLVFKKSVYDIENGDPMMIVLILVIIMVGDDIANRK